jgi:uncharacterized protein YcaQ
LRQAVERLGFVQADPIRSPARAQDLILRHRVKDYRAGDLEQQYARLGLEEDLLYAYGFMPTATWQLLHPRGAHPKYWNGYGTKITAAEQRVLEFALERQCLHPRDLETEFGRKRQMNAWGGQSKATTRTLEALHYRGLLRVVRRENGIRLYEPAVHAHEPLDSAERLRQLVLLIASILQPVTETTLRRTVAHLRYAAPSLDGRLTAVKRLLESGHLAKASVDGVNYIWPAGRAIRTRPQETVRFLAPFDPLVWDRARFEHFWGWPYRFEAYTPPPKRQMGYYAMPLLWRDDVIGWVNVSTKNGELVAEPGYRNGQPTDKAFRVEFDAEVERMRVFLGKRG